MQFRTEGEKAFPDTEKDNSAGSSPDENEEEGKPQSPAGDENKQDEPDKDVPFHKHPRWIQRDKEWNDRLEKLKSDYESKLESLKKDLAPKDDKYPPVPEWFGGDEAQWRAFNDYHRSQVEAAVAPFKEREQMSAAERQAEQEATEWFRAELAAIESDSELNPSKEKIDPNRLLKTAMDFDLVDSNGRWNYRAAWHFLRNSHPAKTQDAKARKQAGAAIVSEPKGEKSPRSYKTSEDFKKAENRPW